MRKLTKADQFVVGVKQTAKAIEQGRAKEVFIARDAEHRVVARVIELCQEAGLPITYVETMRELGAACGIDVGASAVAVIG
ncbi:MAG: hypothetical protein A6D91_00640 [Bacillaceae bacterium G1]|nr:50S ribosomal protein L7Ae-like protein [Bacillota bacterium]OJF16395.1 MAG: hypothetical protein A6D91_00640 [Bacillaceae bacterium G1]